MLTPTICSASPYWAMTRNSCAVPTTDSPNPRACVAQFASSSARDNGKGALIKVLMRSLGRAFADSPGLKIDIAAAWAVWLSVGGRRTSYYSIDQHAEKVRAIVASTIPRLEILQGVCQFLKFHDYIRLRQKQTRVTCITSPVVRKTCQIFSRNEPECRARIAVAF